jgi:hypothetical protein
LGAPGSLSLALNNWLQILSGLVKILKRRVSTEDIEKIQAIVIDTQSRKYYTKYKYILSINLSRFAREDD